MATNKHASVRYQALDKCFSNKYRKYFMEDLIAECNKALSEFYSSKEDKKNDEEYYVKRRTIFADMDYMRTGPWKAPVESYYDGRKCYYRYSDPDYSINKKPLSDSELDSIDEALVLLNRFKGADGFDWVDEFVANFEDKLGRKKQASPVIGYEQNPYLKGIEFLSPLFNYIVNKQALNVQYTPFKSPQRTTVFHPYYLKQYNNRWYVFGIDNERPEVVISLALDRIDAIGQASVQYIVNDRWDFGEYFEDVIGVSVPRAGVVEEVVLKFDRERYSYVRTKPLHPSQRELDKENCVVQIDVMLNRELEALILSYGNEVEVLSPAPLREQIAAKIRSLAEIYK